MRAALYLALLGACSFEPGRYTTDGGSVDMPDSTELTWTIDPSSSKGVPASADEWRQLIEARGLAASVPTNLWLLQEASGMLADSIGPAPLTPIGIPSFFDSHQVTVPGWSRFAVATPELDAERGYSTGATGNLDGTSYLMLVYIAVVSLPPTERVLFGLGNENDHHYVTIRPSGVIAASWGYPGVATAPAVSTNQFGTAVRPIALKLDAASSTYRVYTDLEVLSPPWTATSGFGNLTILGNAVLAAAATNIVYGAMWRGPTAQLADADVKALLQALGWTVSGY